MKDRENRTRQLEEVRLINRQRLQILEEERNKILEERNELEKYLHNISDELAGTHSTAVLELGLQRLENVCVTLLKAADENSKLITDNANSKMINLQKQVEETEGQIKKAKEDIQRELHVIFRILGGEENPRSNTIVKALQADIFGEHTQKQPERRTDAHANIEKIALSVQDEAAAETAAIKEEEVHNQNEEKAASMKTKIGNARYQYMTGKIVGMDLLDKEGEIMIAKGEVINMEHIEKAQQAGKLSELIIHMQLPEMEDPQ